MWGALRTERLLPGHPPPPSLLSTPQLGQRRRIVAFASREPIGRFVASAIEVLERFLNRVSPGGKRIPNSMYEDPGGPFSSTVLASSTSWFAPL
eukprot:CAMPEP_0119339254 /NCGR_PEP_ID=MMETSP1333-20130426/97896_1 /TAXON_ID=418940 /ORGANISM="Scyphosphaera apsteinii, Strain RCC1455" /LENGTH=93 /DNA_ID=CAMNT_0007350747 /DNA_START=522 /DNA_END=800 /DNA_ORIENTATION=+